MEKLEPELTPMWDVGMCTYRINLIRYGTGYKLINKEHQVCRAKALGDHHGKQHTAVREDSIVTSTGDVDQCIPAS